ncbi:D-amino-acid transaminase [Thiolinea disciformis]|uniref:D-amino-acid transaminase n=1 Tax=Thiolinea disciformis TaxID=125614 RepID=UPI0003721F06|nr:D-amino-acid transaminase [Thiolinea disciformis]
MPTTRWVYVNGQFQAESSATISVFDRGFLFADAVYEVNAVVDGLLLDNAAHLARLQRSLSELSIPLPLNLDDLVALQEETVQRNQLREGLLYLQISRGVADRDFALPRNLKPSVVLFTQSKNLLKNPVVERGLSVITVDDIRWQRCDIKTVALLAASMAKQQALDQGADDAWFVRNGEVLEGTSNNVFIINQAGDLITRPLGNDILHGTTRAALVQLTEQHQLNVQERPFSLEEVYQAREAFISSAGTFALPVVQVNNRLIGHGKVGEISLKMRELYLNKALAEARRNA